MEEPADLGIGWRPLLAVAAMAAALAALGLPAGVDAALAAALGTIAGAGTLLVGARRGARTAIAEPLARCTAALERLRDRQPAGRLPEHGPPAVRRLLHAANAAIEAAAARDAACSGSLAAAASSSAQDHLVLESLRDAVIVFDPGGRAVSANAAAVAWFALRGPDVRGTPAVDLLPGEAGSALAEATSRIGLGAATEVQTTGIDHGRRKLDLEVVALPPAADGRPTGMVAAFTDVTRNHEIARLRDELLSSISHELRTPLTNLCSSSEILAQLDPSREPDWRDFVTILTTESHRLKNLIDDVMSYRQVEDHRNEWQIEPHDAERLAADALQLASLRLRKAGVVVDLRVEGRATVACDGPRVLEVLVRLLDNACKFGRPQGRVLVHVQSHGDRVEFGVADDGPGIAPADRQRVFERFVQVGDVMTDKPRGAGLGLSICQRIVDALGGAIWCEDSPLGGAQVRFMLPVVDAPVPGRPA